MSITCPVHHQKSIYEKFSDCHELTEYRYIIGKSLIVKYYFYLFIFAIWDVHTEEGRWVLKRRSQVRNLDYPKSKTYISIITSNRVGPYQKHLKCTQVNMWMATMQFNSHLFHGTYLNTFCHLEFLTIGVLLVLVLN